MINPHDATGQSRSDRLRAWLKSDVTVTLPGWAFALGAAIAVVLLLVAFD